MGEKTRRKLMRLYSLPVSGRDLHFLRQVLTAVLDRWDTLEPKEKNSLDADLAAAKMLLRKAEARALLVRIDECLFRLIPALRHMRMYETALPQMEATSPAPRTVRSREPPAEETAAE